MKTEVRLSVKKIIKKGYGIYFTWIGWCEKCKKFRAHFAPMYGATCSEGHYSDGKITANRLLRRLEKK